MKRWLKVSKDLTKSFSASWASKNPLERRSGCYVSSRQMAMWNNNLFLDVLFGSMMKTLKRCLKVTKPCNLIFCIHGDPKNRNGWSRGKDVSCRWKALRTHNPPSGRPIKRLWWSRRNEISRCRKAMRTQLMYPAKRKNDLNEVALWCFK
jgi:hypothetical protein